ncbi:MAG: GLPGLI family protein [Saprospiraceae bacterium]
MLTKFYFLCSMCLICIFGSTPSYSQDHSSGEIIYKTKMRWAKVVQTLPYLSKEEKDRVLMTWGKDEDNEQGTKYILQWENKKTIYTFKPTIAAEEEHNYSWRKNMYYLTRDYTTNISQDLKETLGKTYLIEDHNIKPKWKILNEIKEVSGYICMKAETIDTVKDQKIIAWFTDQIPLSYGPAEYNGLPGVILEINKNDGNLVIVADEIHLGKKTTTLKQVKMKGKKIKQAQFNELISKHIVESIKSQRNPYWSIDY